jgi:hypothetical protein
MPLCLPATRSENVLKFANKRKVGRRTIRAKCATQRVSFKGARPMRRRGILLVQIDSLAFLGHQDRKSRRLRRRKATE